MDINFKLNIPNKLTKMVPKIISPLIKYIMSPLLSLVLYRKLYDHVGSFINLALDYTHNSYIIQILQIAIIMTCLLMYQHEIKAFLILLFIKIQISLGLKDNESVVGNEQIVEFTGNENIVEVNQYSPINNDNEQANNLNKIIDLAQLDPKKISQISNNIFDKVKTIVPQDQMRNFNNAVNYINSMYESASTSLASTSLASTSGTNARTNYKSKIDIAELNSMSVLDNQDDSDDEDDSKNDSDNEDDSDDEYIKNSMN